MFNRTNLMENLLFDNFSSVRFSQCVNPAKMVSTKMPVDERSRMLMTLGSANNSSMAPTESYKEGSRLTAEY